MVRKIPLVAALLMGLPALAQQPKVSGGETPPANPPQTQAAPDDKKNTPSAASRGEKARQALKALGGAPPAKPKAAPAAPDR